MLKFFVLLSCLGLAFSHDEYRGKCPTFTPMQGFDWNRVSIHNRLNSIIDSFSVLHYANHII